MDIVGSDIIQIDIMSSYSFQSNDVEFLDVGLAGRRKNTSTDILVRMRWAGVSHLGYLGVSHRKQLSLAKN